MKRLKTVFLSFCCLLSLTACGYKNETTIIPTPTTDLTESSELVATDTEKPSLSPTDLIEVKIHEATHVVSAFNGAMDEFPLYDGDFYNMYPFQIELVRWDLSALDLSEHEEALFYSTFDTATIWPDELPGKFDPERVMELGKDPGLGVRALHESGIDGRGVSIGIIDGPLLLNHKEYEGSIVYYDEIDCVDYVGGHAFHGNAVASLAIGENTGVAPGANLYYVASSTIDAEGNLTYKFYAEAMHRLLDINEQLPEGEKIRAISISAAPGEEEGIDGYEEAVSAYERARSEGIMVFSTCMWNFFSVPRISGAGRDPLGDPNDLSCYSLGIWQKPKYEWYKDNIWFPMDSRSFAGWTEENSYEWLSIGGWSWVMPYATGLYALCSQVYPEITYEQFFDAVVSTADTIYVDNLGDNVPIIIVNPTMLVDFFQSKNS